MLNPNVGIKNISWFQRMKDAGKNIIIGFICIIGGIYVLFWNEKNTLDQHKSLTVLEKELTIVPDSTIDPTYNHKPIYTTGTASTKDTLKDTSLNIEVNAIQLTRQVEMYQWEENKETHTTSQMGGSEQEVTTYHYQQIWSPTLIHSQDFHNTANHINPQHMPLIDKTQNATNVTIGAFILSDTAIQEISDKGNPTNVQLSEDNFAYLAKITTLKPHIVDDMIYLGNNPDQPEIGDIKIHVTAIYPQKISIIGMQSDDTIISYPTNYGEEFILRIGQVSAQRMILDEISHDDLLSWAIRAGVLIAFIIGFNVILTPLVVFADVLPIFGSLMSFGTGMISSIAGISLWILLTAIAWMAVRPLLSAGLILAVICIDYFVYRRHRKTQAQSSQQKTT